MEMGPSPSLPHHHILPVLGVSGLDAQQHHAGCQCLGRTMEVIGGSNWGQILINSVNQTIKQWLKIQKLLKTG